MGKKRFTAEQIISKLREAEVLQSSGLSIVEICRQLEIKEQTYYKWRKEYGGMRIDQAKRLKEVEQENSRLKKLVADLSLDNAILKETVRGNY
jgi:transposase-like protein